MVSPARRALASSVQTAEASFRDNPSRVGVGLWLGSGLAAWTLARIVPLGKRRGVWIELAAAIVIAFLLGVAATSLDFGGWNELEWRAALFAFFGALAAVGIIRAV